MRRNSEARSALQDHITLRELATLLRASYFTTYSLAVSGIFGEPIVVGRTYLFPREVAEKAVRERLALASRPRQRGEGVS
jgi:hypothetical protein